MPKTAETYHEYGEDVTIQKYLNEKNIEKALVFVKNSRAYWVHYPFNAPFANRISTPKTEKTKTENSQKNFPDYRYFIADENDVVEVSMDEL